MILRNWTLFLLLAIFAGILAGCSEAAGPSAATKNTPTFEFYRTDTPTPSRTPTLPGTSTPLPSPSPTSRAHAIVRGDTFSGIAFKYGVSIPALQASNPELDPNMLIVGTVVFIPPPGTPSSGTPSIPSPTPVSLEVGQPVCYRAGDGGLGCFAEVTNPQSFAVESVSGSILLAGEDGQVHSQDAALILNILPAGASLPLTAYFPPPVPDPLQVDAQVSMVLPLNEGDSRYPKAEIEDLAVVIAPGGLSAEVSGEVVLKEEGVQATAVWVAVAAYDSQGNPTGLRRWESSQPLKAGESLPFKFKVYASGEAINQVKSLAEAHR
jgi:LysM repeat protein